MSDDLHVKNGITIPASELKISTSRAGGPGGQHVNKADTRVTITWDVTTTTALHEAQKERILERLASQLTKEGELIVSNGSTRSQMQNKKRAREQLARKVTLALRTSKKRIKSKTPAHIKEKRLRKKKSRSNLKKSRGKVEY